MTKTVWEVARLSKINGVHTVWTVDTTQISQRVRRNAIRMMRSGVVVGWGNAAKLCHALCKHYGVSYTQLYSAGYGSNRNTIGLNIDDSTFKPESLPAVRDKVRAGISGELLTEEREYRIATLRAELEQVDSIGTKELWVRFRSTSQAQMLSFIAEHISPLKVVHTSRVADELEKDQHILIEQMQY